MSEEQEIPKRRHARLLLTTAAGIAILGLLLLAAWHFERERFDAWARGKIIDKLSQVSGGRVEFQSFHWTPWRLKFDLRDVTIHGLEPPGEAPYLHVNRLVLRARIVSLLGRQIALRLLELDRPSVHAIVNPDGTTNIPAPAIRQNPASSPAERLFDVVISRIELNDGVLLLNERSFPLNVTASQVGLVLGYIRPEERYDGILKVGTFTTQYKQTTPVTAGIEADFSLRRRGMRLNTLKVASGQSALHATGELRDWAAPNFNLSYGAELDVAQLAPIFGATALKSGRLSVQGQVGGSAEAFSSSGKLAFRDLDYSDGTVRLAKMSGGSDFSATAEELSLLRLTAGLLGGAVTGDAEITNWIGKGVARPANSRDRPPTRGRSETMQQMGVARLQVRDLLLSRIFESISTRAFPLNSLNVAGSVNGSLDVHWKDSIRNLLAQLAVNVAPPAVVAAGQLPVTAKVLGVYDRGRRQLAVEQLSLATRATQLKGSGVLGAFSRLQVTASSTDPSEWQPLLSALGNRQPWPVQVHGHAAFDGSVSGEIGNPSISGTIQIADFDALVTSPSAPVRRAHWDSLSAGLDYSPNFAAVHNAVLKQGHTQINFDFSTELRRGVYSDTMPVALRAAVRDAEASDLLAILGYSYPISGTLNLNLQASGTEADPRARGHVLLVNGHIYGEQVQRFSSDLRLARHEAELTNLEIAQNGAALTGSAAYNLASTALNFRLRGTKFNLANIERLKTPRVSLGGELSFTVTGSGTRQAPAVNGEAQVRNLVMNGERVGSLRMTASTANSVTSFQIRPDVANPNLLVEGTTQLQGEYPSTLSIRMTGFDVDPLLRAFVNHRLAAHFSMTGAIRVQGPLLNPADYTMDGDIEQFSTQMEYVQLRNQGSIRFTAAQGSFRFEPFQLAGTDTNLTARGRVQLTGPQALDFGAHGTLNLRLLRSLNPDLVSYGQANFDVHFGGSVPQPMVDGGLEIAGAGLSYVDLPNGLSEINGRLTFNQDRLQVVKLTAKSGGGALNIGGFVTFGQTPGFNLTVAGQNVRLRYPPGVSSVADVNLHLSGSSRNPLLSGEVTVTRFGLNPEFDFSLYLARAKLPAETTGTQPFLSRVRLDIHVVSTPELQVQTSAAKVSGEVDLRVRGTIADPVLLGRVNIIEGDVYFYGTKYRVQRGEISFRNPVRLEPLLDLQATATVRGYDITLGFHGPLNKLSTTYRSDPPLATADIVNLLAFGTTREESALRQAQAQLPEAASYELLNRALNAAISSRVQRVFGYSHIKIDPQPQTTGVASSTAGPTVTIEQQVANKLTITYISNLTRTNYQTIQAEYNLNRNISIVAVRDWNGIVSFDVRVRQRKR